MKECAVFVDTMYTKRHGRQLWEKSWIVREPNSAHHGYAVAVKRRGVVIDHLPRKLSRLCLLILGLEINGQSSTKVLCQARGRVLSMLLMLDCGPVRGVRVRALPVLSLV